MNLPEALEQAAGALPRDAEAIRPANGDPGRLLAALDAHTLIDARRAAMDDPHVNRAQLA